MVTYIKEEKGFHYFEMKNGFVKRVDDMTLGMLLKSLNSKEELNENGN